MQQDFPDAYLLGEVWEDGTTKVAYSKRRRYLLGGGLHGLMNYPFRTALLPYLAGTSGAEDFRDAMETIRENYPSPAFYGAMNFLSTHDTPRLLTLLGCEQPPGGPRCARALPPIPRRARARHGAAQGLAALVLYAFPGSPTVYYGDEAGMEGFEDPFNRRTYPWGHEDTALLDWFRTLGRLRAERESLQSGDIAYPLAAGRVLCFARRAGDEVSLCAVNAGAESASVDLPWAAPLGARRAQRPVVFGRRRSAAYHPRPLRRSAADGVDCLLPFGFPCRRLFALCRFFSAELRGAVSKCFT